MIPYVDNRDQFQLVSSNFFILAFSKSLKTNFRAMKYNFKLHYGLLTFCLSCIGPQKFHSEPRNPIQPQSVLYLIAFPKRDVTKE